jgi:hypothetical protein
MRSEWKRLTIERNQLVHSTLLAYDLESHEGCIALCEYLDEQYERARVLIERLRHQQRTRSLAALAFKQILESGELKRLLAEPAKASSPGELPPQALPEPYVSLSTHTAPDVQPPRKTR